MIENNRGNGGCPDDKFNCPFGDDVERTKDLVMRMDANLSLMSSYLLEIKEEIIETREMMGPLVDGIVKQSRGVPVAIVGAMLFSLLIIIIALIAIDSDKNVTLKPTEFST